MGLCCHAQDVVGRGLKCLDRSRVIRYFVSLGEVRGRGDAVIGRLGDMELLYVIYDA